MDHHNQMSSPAWGEEQDPWETCWQALNIIPQLKATRCRAVSKEEYSSQRDGIYRITELIAEGSTGPHQLRGFTTQEESQTFSYFLVESTGPLEAAAILGRCDVDECFLHGTQTHGPESNASSDTWIRDQQPRPAGDVPGPTPGEAEGPQRSKLHLSENINTGQTEDDGREYLATT